MDIYEKIMRRKQQQHHRGKKYQVYFQKKSLQYTKGDSRPGLYILDYFLPQADSLGG